MKVQAVKIDGTYRQALMRVKAANHLKLNRIKELFNDEMQTLQNVSGYWKAFNRYRKQNTSYTKEFDQIEKELKIPMWEQAHFLAGVFKDLDPLNLQKTVDLLLVQPAVLHRIDYWALQIDDVSLEKIKEFLSRLNPNSEMDWRRFRSLENLYGRFGSTSEMFWGKALKSVLSISERRLRVFQEFFLQFPQPIQMESFSEADLNKLSANSDLKVFLHHISSLSVDVEFDNEMLELTLKETKNLKCLDLCFRTELNLEFLHTSDIKLDHLESVDFAFSGVTDVGLLALLRKAGKIQKLDLEFCPRLSEGFPDKLAIPFKN